MAHTDKLWTAAVRVGTTGDLFGILDAETRARRDAETRAKDAEWAKWLTEAHAAFEEATRFIPADEMLSEEEASWLDFAARWDGFDAAGLDGEILYTVARRLRTLGTEEASALADRLVMLCERYEGI